MLDFGLTDAADEEPQSQSGAPVRHNNARRVYQLALARFDAADEFRRMIVTAALGEPVTGKKLVRRLDLLKFLSGDYIKRETG